MKNERPNTTHLRFLAFLLCLALLHRCLLDIRADDVISPLPANMLQPIGSILRNPPATATIPNPPSIPIFAPPGCDLAFSSEPTDREIILARCFLSSLFPLPGPQLAKENYDLANALVSYAKLHKPDPLVEFFYLHPDTRWRPALLLNIGLVFESEGMWSKTIPAWEESWSSTKAFKSGPLKAIADKALGKLATMHGQLGHYSRLRELLDEIKEREVRGPGAEMVREAEAGLRLMEIRPDEAFRCGPLALSNFYSALLPQRPLPSEFIAFKSSEQGTNMADLISFAEKVGLPCQVAYRSKGAAVLVPCVVNWNVQHFSAITQVQDGGYISKDPTFGKNCLVSTETLDAEASGYFVVRKGPLPVGWRVVSDSEARIVLGKGSTGGAPGPGPGPCKGKPVGGNGAGGGGGPPGPQPAGGGGGGGGGGGRGPGGGGFGPKCSKGMTTYSFDPSTISLMLEDTPVGYEPPVGLPSLFTAVYNHRDITDRSNVGNLGDNWSFEWFSYIQAPSTAATTCYGPGNGEITYTGYNSSTGFFSPELMSQDVLQLVATNSYVLTHKDGSKEIYNLPDSSTPARVFRSASIDAQGNQIAYGYDSYFRLQTVTDAIGQVTVLTYGLSSDPTNPNFYLITKVTDPFGRFAGFQYDETGQLISITDVLGLVSSYTYGAGDFITALTTPYGTTNFVGSDIPTTGTQYERWLQATDPLGGTEKIEWTNNANNFQDVNSSGSATSAPAGFTNAYLNFRTTFYWDKKAMESDPNDYNSAEIYHFCHDSADISLMGYVIESTKEPFENRVWMAYPGQSQTNIPGTTDQPSKVARILDNGTEQDYSYQYNAIDNLTQVVDPVGRKTNISYASNSIDVLQITQTNGSGLDLLGAYTYNSQHLPLSYTDASGQTTNFSYNSAGQLLSVTDALSETTSFAYNGNGYLTSITGPVSGAVETYSYDGFGRVNSVTEADGYTVSFAYDAADRLVSVTYPDGTYRQTIYNKLDAEWERDRLGNWTFTLYDPLQRIILRRDPLQRETVYERCPCGALIGLIDPNGNQTKWIIDNQGRITKKTFADSSSVTYVYENTTSRIKAVTDAYNQTKTFTFNLDNSVSQITYTGAINPTANVTFGYDAVYPRVLTMADGTGTTTYSYNPITSTPALGAGRLASVAGPIANSTIGFVYDALGRVRQRSVNGSANAESLIFDALGRIGSITNLLGTFTTTYVNETNRLASLSYPNGLQTLFSYYPNSSGGGSGNGDDRLETLSNLTPSSNNLSTFGYTYDSNGEIQTWSTQLDSTSAQTASFRFDVAQQLVFASIPTTASTPAQAYTYTFDAAGNRTQEEIDNSITTSTFNNLNQLTSQAIGGGMHFTGTISAPGTITLGGNAGAIDGFGNWTATTSVVAGANAIPLVATDLNGNIANKTVDVTVIGTSNSGIAYDLNGNLLNNGSGQSYAWDAENRLVSIIQASGTTGFVYNGLGQRVRETLNGSVIKQWIWDSDPEPLEERDPSGNVSKRFYGFLGEQISGSSYYFTTDHLSSIREVTDSSGTNQARYSYDPFGRRTLLSGTDLADFGFAGYYYHKASNLYLTRARGLAPNLGRWLSRDPEGEFAGINIYEYCVEDPVNSIDPFGTCNLPFGGNAKVEAGIQNAGKKQDIAISDQLAEAVRVEMTFKELMKIRKDETTDDQKLQILMDIGKRVEQDPKVVPGVKDECTKVIQKVQQKISAKH